MWLFNREKKCEICNAPTFKKELFDFCKNNGNEVETIQMCKNCFLSEIEKSIKEFDFKVVAVHPLLKKQGGNSYQFYSYSQMEKYNFDDKEIENVKNIISSSVLNCDFCGKDKTNFVWVSSEINGSECCSGLIKVDDSLEKEYLCSECMAREFIRFLNNPEIIKIINFYTPPQEDCYGSTFEY